MTISDPIRLTGQEVLNDVEEANCQGKEVALSFLVDGELVNIDDVVVQVEYITPDRWIKSGESCVDNVYLESKDGLIEIAVRISTDASNYHWFEIEVSSAEGEVMFSELNKMDAEWHEGRSLECSINDEYANVEVVNNGQCEIYVQFKYQDGADLFIDVTEVDEFGTEAHPYIEVYRTQEEIYEANNMKSFAVIRRCNNCGFVSWNDMDGECESCDDSDPTILIGHQVDIKEDTEDTDCLRNAETFGFTKHTVVSVNEKRGYVRVKAGFPIFVKDIA